MAKQTPLYGEHLRLEGKMVEFGGWELPVQYPAGIKAEHMAVREKCGIFDVSHMGEFRLCGSGAEDYLNYVLTNDYTGMPDGRVRYSPMCGHDGGVIDDLLVCREKEGSYLIVVNASNTEKDFAWMREQLAGFDAELTDVSADYALLALQGPASERVLARLADLSRVPQKYYTVNFDAVVSDVPCILSRTGYTGEDGFEIYVAPANAVKVWRAILEAGEEEGILPCGLGARDTLRLEAAMPLYGHEMDETVTPAETGLGFFVKMDKADFIGRKALGDAGEPARCRVGLAVTGRGIVREHEEVKQDGRVVGHTTSGTLCPYVNAAVAMALVERGAAEIGTKLTVDVRGRDVETEVVALPFYKRSK